MISCDLEHSGDDMWRKCGMNALIRVRDFLFLASGGLGDISLGLLYFSRSLGVVVSYAYTLYHGQRIFSAHATSESFQTIIDYVAIHVTLHGGRISEKRGKEEEEDNDDIRAVRQ